MLIATSKATTDFTEMIFVKSVKSVVDIFGTVAVEKMSFAYMLELCRKAP
jgi:hypothetical protein